MDAHFVVIQSTRSYLSTFGLFFCDCPVLTTPASLATSFHDANSSVASAAITGTSLRVRSVLTNLATPLAAKASTSMAALSSSVCRSARRRGRSGSGVARSSLAMAHATPVAAEGTPAASASFSTGGSDRKPVYFSQPAAWRSVCTLDRFQSKPVAFSDMTYKQHLPRARWQTSKQRSGPHAAWFRRSPAYSQSRCRTRTSAHQSRCCCWITFFMW